MSKFNWSVRVYYEDTDAVGVVYYANYLKFLERARTEMLRVKGFEQDDLIKTERIFFVVRSINIDYLSPARFNENIDISSEISRLKKASILFNQSIYRGETLLCKATANIACLDVNSMRPKAIPANLIAKFKELS